MPRMICEGWWEQIGLGRQPMERLVIEFENGQLQGEGQDIVGPFRISGTLSDDHLLMLKTYIGKHTVCYEGESLGEGRYQGEWTIGEFDRGNWEIFFKAVADTDPDDIQNIGG